MNRILMASRRHALSLFGGGAALALTGGCAAAGEGEDKEMKDMDLTGGLPVEREFFFDAKPGPEVRDASNVWIEDAAGTVGLRVGIEHVAELWDTPELWLDIAFADGRVISGREFGASGPDGQPRVKRCGPIQFECIEPFKHWRVTCDPHKFRELSAQQLIALDIPDSPPMREVAFSIDYYMAVPPLISGTLSKESKELMSGEQGSFISPRYEQLCKAKGWLSVDGEKQEFDGNLLRIKRQGVRKFDGFWGHCWLEGLMPSGKAFGVNTFPPRDDKPNFNEGYIFDGSGELIPAKAVVVPWMKDLQAGGEPLKLVLETDDGRQETITGETYIACRSVSTGSVDLPEDWPIVQQAHAKFTWGDETTTGMIERSTAPSKMKL